MIAAEFAVTLFIAMLLASLFVFAFGWGRTDTTEAWPALLFFFLIVWFGAWAVGRWVVPWGPIFWGVPVLTFFFIALLFALVLAAAVPAARTRRPYRVGGPSRAPGEDSEAAVGFGIFFWILLLLFLVVLLAGLF